MPGSRKWSVTTFNDIWLADERFKRWLKKVPGDLTKALCILCNKKIDITNIGVSALVSHKSFKKHSDKEKVHLLGSMFFTKTAPAVASKPASLSTSNPMMSQTRLNICTCGSSAKLMEYQNRTFTLFIPIRCHHKAFVWCNILFPDSEVAKQYTMIKDKVSYFVLYGIALVFKEELITTVYKSPFYFIGFNESLCFGGELNSLWEFCKFLNL